jgi:hypothetical protein
LKWNHVLDTLFERPKEGGTTDVASPRKIYLNQEYRLQREKLLWNQGGLDLIVTWRPQPFLYLHNFLLKSTNPASSATALCHHLCALASLRAQRAPGFTIPAKVT